MTQPLSDGETFITVLMLSIGILMARFLPFLLFSRKEKIPRIMLYLGSVLPHSAMTMLLVYCLKDVSLLTDPNGLPELIAVLFTVALHLWRKNVLLSIASGTVLYMALVQKVFAP